MATKKTGKPRGRPKGARKDFRTDPDRVAIAYAWLMIESGFEEGEAYSKAAMFLAPLYEMKDHPRGGVFFEIDSYRGLFARPASKTAVRLRQKGKRWADDPDATAHIKSLMKRMVAVSDSLESSGSGDFLPRLWREWKAL